MNSEYEPRKRVALMVYVDLDPVPGHFHTEDIALNNLRGILENVINRYNPTVMMAPEAYQPKRIISVNTIPLKDKLRHMHAPISLTPSPNGVVGNYNVNEARNEIEGHTEA